MNELDNLLKSLDGMNEEALTKLETRVREVLGNRGDVNLEDIKPGMPPERLTRARVEVAKALKEAGIRY